LKAKKTKLVSNAKKTNNKSVNVGGSDANKYFVCF